MLHEVRKRKIGKNDLDDKGVNVAFCRQFMNRSYFKHTNCAVNKATLNIRANSWNVRYSSSLTTPHLRGSGTHHVDVACLIAFVWCADITMHCPCDLSVVEEAAALEGSICGPQPPELFQ